MPVFKLGSKDVISQTDANQPIIADNVKFPAGHVIQFKQVSTTQEYLTTSTTQYTEFTALNLNITPSQPNSKLLIILTGHISAGTSNNITVEVVSYINGANTMSYVGTRTNTNAIVDRSEQGTFHRIYAHGQTSSFSQLALSWKFRRYAVSSAYAETAFNYDGHFANTGHHYVMEIV